MNFGKFIVIALNFVLIYFFSSSVYNFVGFVYTVLALVLTMLLRNTPYCYGVINILVKNWRKNELIKDENGREIMLSAAFLVGAMKIAAILGVFVEFGVIAIIFLAIFLASGFWFDGDASGMTISVIYFIAKFVGKIAIFLYSIFDKVMELIVKLEFKILGIKEK